MTLSRPQCETMLGRILFLTKYARSGASSRYRSYQYFPWLEKRGLACDVSPLFDDEYLENRYSKGRGSKLDIVRALLRRFKAIAVAGKYDLIVIEYELFPYFPAIFERMLTWMGVRYVVDYDDALFHQYDLHWNPIVRWLLGGKIATVMQLAESVIAGNDYLADYARRSRAKQVDIIPTVVDIEKYSAVQEINQDEKFIIGWIGSPSTAKYLHEITPALANVCKDGKAQVRLIGSGPIELPGVDLEIMTWCENTEAAMIHSFDVGIMPLPDESWARGKCGFKLIQYMACALPVVASPVGVNISIVEHGVNGFLAEINEEWEKAFQVLMDNREQRTDMGKLGRVKVENEFCIQATIDKMGDLLGVIAQAN